MAVFGKVYYILISTQATARAACSITHTTQGTFEGIEKYTCDRERLYEDMSECRVIKSPEEIEILRYAAKVSSEAHKAVMRKVEPGMYEHQLESLFLHECYSRGGARFAAYTCVWYVES